MDIDTPCNDDYCNDHNILVYLLLWSMVCPDLLLVAVKECQNYLTQIINHAW